jgi:hypothetical protein
LQLCSKHELSFALFPEGHYSIHGSVREIKTGFLAWLMEASVDKILKGQPVTFRYSAIPHLDLIPMVQNLGWKECHRRGRKDSFRSLLRFLGRNLTSTLGYAYVQSGLPVTLKTLQAQHIRTLLTNQAPLEESRNMDLLHLFIYIYALINKKIDYDGIFSFMQERAPIPQPELETGLKLFFKIHQLSKSSEGVTLTDDFERRLSYIIHNNFSFTAGPLMQLIQQPDVKQQAIDLVQSVTSIQQLSNADFPLSIDYTNIDKDILNHFNRISLYDRV